MPPRHGAVDTAVRRLRGGVNRTFRGCVTAPRRGSWTTLPGARLVRGAAARRLAGLVRGLAIRETARVPDAFDSHAPQDVYDAFLSYNHKDKAAVEELAHRLTDHGLRVFFDAWTMVPGMGAQDGLERGLRRSRSYVVFLGPSGCGPWQTAEVRIALATAIDDSGFRVIPVLLDGHSEDMSDALPGFLSLSTRIDMRDEHRFDAAFPVVRRHTWARSGPTQTRPDMAAHC
jgi:TIR domain